MTLGKPNFAINPREKKMKKSIADKFVLVFFATCMALFALPASAKDVLYACEPDSLREKGKLILNSEFYQGGDGWFGRSVDFETLFELSIPAKDMFKTLNKILKQKDTQLIYVPVIPRGMLSGELIPNDGFFPTFIYDTETVTEDYTRSLNNLSAEIDVPIINMLETLQKNKDFPWEKFFFRRDLHWTPDAARIVANHIGDVLDDDFKEDPADTNFETVKTGNKLRVGAAWYLALNGLCQDEIPFETVDEVVTNEISDSLDDLFGDDTGDEVQRDFLHLVGTSFSNESKTFNFPGFLKESLSRPIVSFAIAGGGTTSSILKWALEMSETNSSPKYLVWEDNQMLRLNRQHSFISARVIPSLIGDCSADNVIYSQSFESSNSVEFDFDIDGLKEQKFYTQLNYNNVQAQRFTFDVSSIDSSSERFITENPRRVSGLRRMYYEFPDTSLKDFNRMTLSFEDDLKVSGELTFCRFPTWLSN